jgi:ATP-dependent helicase/nuclease subunit A
VIAESAYEFELAGPRARQARENLKKIRALVRRIQNRGYTTLARVTEHLDRLSAGDESNAAFDAVDAVNLMTVHAAKGLEFPIVFLVHLGKGAGGGRDPIRLSGVTEDETPSIAVGDFRSEADDDAALREREETKRLLYVAVTRARDRLYFSSVLADRGKEAVFLAGRGGLGDVLPQDFRQIFVDATRGNAAELPWVSGGAAHRFRVCRNPEGQTPPSPQLVPTEQAPFDLERLGGLDADRGNMAAVELSGRRGPVGAPIAPDADARLVGLVVHRLLDRYGVAPPGSAALAAAADALLSRDERLMAEKPQQTLAEAVRRYRTLVSRPDVLALFRDARAWHEVPISAREAGSLLRGAIDTLVIGSDDRASVLEFKTGRASEAHQRQLARYVDAAARFLQGIPVNGVLVYATDEED